MSYITWSETTVRENTVEYSLGKLETSVARWVAVVLVLSPVLVFAQGQQTDADTARLQSARNIEFAALDETAAGVDVPAVEVPPASVEGAIDVPTDGPLAGDSVTIPGTILQAPQGAPGFDPSSPLESIPMGTAVTGEFMPSQYGGAVAGEPAPVFSTGSWMWNGRWYLNADYVVLKKDAPSDRLVSFDTDANLNALPDQFSLNSGGWLFQNALSTDDENFEFESGMRISFGRFLGRDGARRDHLVDFTFYGLFDWVAAAEQIGGNLRTGLSAKDLRQDLLGITGGPNSAPLIEGFFFNDRQNFRYSSDLDSFEVNYRIRTRPGRDQMAIHPSGAWTRHASSGQLRSFSMGLRGMSINEGFLSEAFVESDRTGMYRVRTGNDLFGPQIGLEVIQARDFWHFGFRSTLGTLVNFADRRSEFESVIEDPVAGEVISERAQQDDEEHISILAQLGVYGAVRLRSNLSIRAAYDFMYVTGLGIAPNNARLAEEFPGFHTTGDALYHGASFGFESEF